MRDAAILARDKGVRLHTHLAENDEDIACRWKSFGLLPGDYAESLGWTGDVWHAHCVKLSDKEIDLFARSGTGRALPLLERAARLEDRADPQDARCGRAGRAWRRRLGLERLQPSGP